MALYSDLILKLKYTYTNDGGSVLIEDNTGVYDPENPTLNPGGYKAEDGVATATRPKESQVVKFLMYRPVPFDVDTENIPSTAISPPHTYGLLGENGDPLPDTVYQWIFMVASTESFPGWAGLYAAAVESGEPWTYLVDYFRDAESPDPVQIGQTAVPVMVNANNCVNNARFGLFPESCDMQPWQNDFGWQIGVTKNAIMGQSLIIDSGESNAYYDEAQLELDKLNQLCTDPNCNCNC